MAQLTGVSTGSIGSKTENVSKPLRASTLFFSNIRLLSVFCYEMCSKILFSAKFHNILSLLPFAQLSPSFCYTSNSGYVCVAFFRFSLTAMCRPHESLSVLDNITLCFLILPNTKTEILSSSHFTCVCASQPFNPKKFLHHHCHFFFSVAKAISRAQNRKHSKPAAITK